MSIFFVFNNLQPRRTSTTSASWMCSHRATGTLTVLSQVCSSQSRSSPQLSTMQYVLACSKAAVRLSRAGAW
jgi:hypothetical protein